MLDEAFKQTPAWKAAMEENRKSLLSGSKFGKFLSDAREEMVPLKTKLSNAFSEIDRVGKELGYSAKEIEAAKEKAKKEISGDKGAEKSKTQSDNLIAASRGSVEAYKIINQNRDNTTVAVKDLHKATIAALGKVQTAIESQSTQAASASIPVYNGGRV